MTGSPCGPIRCGSPTVPPRKECMIFSQCTSGRRDRTFPFDHFATARRYPRTDSTENTTMIPIDHATAPHTSLPAGVPSQSDRNASTTVVKGLFSANAFSQSGIDPVGTNADDAKVIGKITMKPSACADSADDECSATNANTHEKA